MSSKGVCVVVGSGIVGRSWALIFARGGFDVRLYDTQASQCEAAVKGICESAQALSDSNLLFGQAVKDVTARVSIELDLQKALKGAKYVQECTPESLKIKTIVFNNIDKNLDETAGTVLGSSASNLTASQFAAEMKHKSQVLVAHPVNPPFAIPVVELVPAPFTDAKVVTSARAFLKDCGMAPVTLKKEIDGFLINRMQYALLCEAVRLVEDGIASPEDIDTAISQGLGLRWSFMGPFQTIDLNAPGGVKDYAERYSSAILRVVKTQDNSRDWKQETVDEIHAAMRKEVPMDKRADRLAWRDGRLVRLAVHKQQEAQRDQDQK